MLGPSRLYSFLDSKQGFSVHFFDGQKITEDLVMTHSLKGGGFNYFIDTLLSLIPMIYFLKHGESLGIYIDSDLPYFRLKIETNYAGHTRTLLLPEDFNLFPERITGKIRVTKQFPSGHAPYTSILEVQDIPSHQLANELLTFSYQAKATTIVSEHSDQSLLLLKLPAQNVNLVSNDTELLLKDYAHEHHDFFDHIFRQFPNDVEKVVGLFEQGPFAYLSARHVGFFCPCSKERMTGHLRLLKPEELNHIFGDMNVAEARCDYCKIIYQISPEDLLTPPLLN